MVRTIKDIQDILPSMKDVENFIKSQKESTVFQIKGVEDAIKEKYDGKIKTHLSFEMISDNKFKCELVLGSNRFNSMFKFISFHKNLYESFPVEVFGFSDTSFGIAENMSEFDTIITNIIKDKRTEYLILCTLL